MHDHVVHVPCLCVLHHALVCSAISYCVTTCMHNALVCCTMHTLKIAVPIIYWFIAFSAVLIMLASCDYPGFEGYFCWCIAKKQKGFDGYFNQFVYCMLCFERGKHFFKMSRSGREIQNSFLWEFIKHHRSIMKSQVLIWQRKKQRVELFTHTTYIIKMPGKQTHPFIHAQV